MPRARSSIDRMDDHRDLPGRGGVLERAQRRPAVEPRHQDVEHDHVGPLAPRDLDRLGSVGRVEDGDAVGLELEAQQPARAVVVVHDERAPAGRDRAGRGGRGELGLAAGQLAGQRDREDRALARRALDGDRSSEQQRELAHDREPQARAAARLVRGGLSLAKLLEDGVLLLGGDPDPRVGDDEGPLAAPARLGADLDRCPVSVNLSALPTRFARICVSFAESLMIALDVRRDTGLQLEVLAARRLLEVHLRPAGAAPGSRRPRAAAPPCRTRSSRCPGRR